MAALTWPRESRSGRCEHPGPQTLRPGQCALHPTKWWSPACPTLPSPLGPPTFGKGSLRALILLCWSWWISIKENVPAVARPIMEAP